MKFIIDTDSDNNFVQIVSLVESSDSDLVQGFYFRRRLYEDFRLLTLLDKLKVAEEKIGKIMKEASTTNQTFMKGKSFFFAGNPSVDVIFTGYLSTDVRILINGEKMTSPLTFDNYRKLVETLQDKLNKERNNNG